MGLSRYIVRLFQRRESSDEPASVTDGGLIKQIIVGLGSPGKKYQGTRHNAGFIILERMAERGGVTFKPYLKWKSEVAVLGECLLVKPLTFMNESGRAVRLLADFYKIPATNCLVVYDDVALPFGELRIRRDGSAGGHNGMKSLIACLGCQEFPRLRFGVGEAGSSQLATHVLGKFSPSELSELPLFVEDAVAAVEQLMEEGIDAAMARWNGKARPKR